jgi:hypothetical protein
MYVTVPGPESGPALRRSVPKGQACAVIPKLVSERVCERCTEVAYPVLPEYCGPQFVAGFQEIKKVL